MFHNELLGSTQDRDSCRSNIQEESLMMYCRRDFVVLSVSENSQTKFNGFMVLSTITVKIMVFLYELKK